MKSLWQPMLWKWTSFIPLTICCSTATLPKSIRWIWNDTWVWVSLWHSSMLARRPDRKLFRGLCNHALAWLAPDIKNWGRAIREGVASGNIEIQGPTEQSKDFLSPRSGTWGHRVIESWETDRYTHTIHYTYYNHLQSHIRKPPHVTTTVACHGWDLKGDRLIRLLSRCRLWPLHGPRGLYGKIPSTGDDRHVTDMEKY